MFNPSIINNFFFKERFFQVQDMTIFGCYFKKSFFEKKLFKEFEIYFPKQIELSVEKRQAEFFAGRYAARKAILKSNLHNFSVPDIHIGKHKSPIWPSKTKGSIAHNSCIALCAIVAEHPTKTRFIGIDLENHLTCSSEIESSIHTMKEKSLLTVKGLSENISTTLIFSAKESLFKAIYPIVGEYFGFEHAEVCAINLKKKYLKLTLSPQLAHQTNLTQSIKCQFRLQNNTVFTLVHN